MEEAGVQLIDEDLEITEKLDNIIQSNERERLPSIKKMKKRSKYLIEEQNVNVL